MIKLLALIWAVTLEICVLHADAGIIKLGTIAEDIVETTPFVFKDKLYRLEYIRKNSCHNRFDLPYHRIVSYGDSSESYLFAFGYELGSAFVEGEKVYVSCVEEWGGDTIFIFSSRDFISWDKESEIYLDGYEIYNTSICRNEELYILMFEIGAPETECGVPFTARFANSYNMRDWVLTPSCCNFDKNRYTAPHCLRYLDGYYYNFYLEALSYGFEQWVVRSKDFVHWEYSPKNPILKHSIADKSINRHIRGRAKQRIRRAENCNNSDIDFCEYNGHLIINYSWGNQRGTDFLGEAIFPGTEEEFLRSLF